MSTVGKRTKSESDEQEWSGFPILMFITLAIDKGYCK